MAYTIPEEILETWPKVATAGVTGPEMRAHIDRVASRIDAALAHRYAVPFADPTPPIIKTLAIEGTVVDVLHRHQNPPEWITALAEQFLDTLKMLAAGDMSVVGATGGVLAEVDGSAPLSTTSAYTPTFGVAPSLGERVDPDRADAEAADRE